MSRLHAPNQVASSSSLSLRPLEGDVSWCALSFLYSSLLLTLLLPLADTDGSCHFLTSPSGIIAGTSRGSSARNHLLSAFSAKVVLGLLFFFQIKKKKNIVLRTQLEATYALCSWAGVFLNTINVFCAPRIPQRKRPQRHLSRLRCSATRGNLVFCRCGFFVWFFFFHLFFIFRHGAFSVR